MNSLLLWAFGGSLICAASMGDTSPPAIDQRAGASDLSNPAHFDLADCINPLGYDGLDPSIRERDVARVLAALREHANVDRWPTREVAHAVDLKGYPESVQIESRREPVPIYLIVDPRAIDEAWEHADAKVTGTARYLPFDKKDAHIVVAFFEPVVLQSNLSLPWPSWAENAWSSERGPRFYGMHQHRWGAASTTVVAWNVVMRAGLERQGVKLHTLTYVAHVSENVWRVMPNWQRERQPPATRGTLVFPLWESVGLLRPDDGTHRTTPLSATVQAREPAAAIPEAPGFILPGLITKAGDRPRREFVVLPETLATLPVPVATFTLAPGSRPLAEDYILDIGIPLNSDGLVAVCIFATITDEQLAALAAALTE